MPDMSMPSGDPFPLDRSDYYRMHLLERQAIDVHKWLLSEKTGKDVGLSFAQWDWVMGGHRARWLEQTRLTRP